MPARDYERGEDFCEDTKVHSVYHDGDGSVFTYNKAGDLLPYPSDWPEHIAHVRTFCQERGINYHK